MAVFLSPVGGAGAQFFDNNGDPLIGGKLYTYFAGTTTAQGTYISSTGSVFHTNPIILDSAGRIPAGGEVWLNSLTQYKFVLKTQNDVLIGSWDNISNIAANEILYTDANNNVSTVQTVLRQLQSDVVTLQQNVNTVEAQAASTAAAFNSAAMNISVLNTATSPADNNDLMLIRQGTVNKKITVQTVRQEFAVDAEAAAVVAEAAADRAELARDAAMLNGRLYASTVAGLAATTNGQYFAVPQSAPNDIYADLYLNNAGVATYINTYPSSNFINDRLIPDAEPGYQYMIVDQYGRAAFGITDDGDTEVSNLILKQSSTTDEVKVGGGFNIIDDDGRVAFNVTQDGTTEVVNLRTNGGDFVDDALVGYVFNITDEDGNAVVGINSAGRLHFSDSLTQDAEIENLQVGLINGLTLQQVMAGSWADQGVTQNFIADINHIGVYGQSLSLGVNTYAPISTTPIYDSLKFTAARAAVTALTETCYNGTVVVNPGETPSFGTAQAVKQLIQSENGISYQQQYYRLFLSNDGQSGTAIAGLVKGTAPYSNLIDSATAAFAYAQSQAKTYNYPAVTWAQGETDYGDGTSFATYKSELISLAADLNVDLPAITGQTNAVSLISYQTASHKAYGVSYPNIALAQLSAAIDSPNIYMACPMYMLPYDADNVHLTAASSKKMGFYFGLAYKRIVVDGVNWSPLRPIDHFKQGAVATIKFHVPFGKLMFDTTQVSENTNFGFNLFDSVGNPIALSSVTITGPDTVRIVAGSSIPTGAKLQYAFYGTGTTGPVNGPRGNLRDTQGDVIVFDPSGLNYPAHNWCVMFELIF